MRHMAIVGFIIWAAATAGLRIGGQYVFRETSTRAAVLLLLVSLPVMVIVALQVLRRYRTAEERALAAIVLVAPGMALDTISSMWFSRVFPNIRADAAGLFGGWLLFCNVIVLLTAIVSSRSAIAVDRG